MSLLCYWQELRDFWLGIAMWAATRRFTIVSLYAPDDIVIGMMWSDDEAFIKYAIQYEPKEQ